MSQSRNVKYVSRKQFRANRRNAQQSTGPRTEDGKARSALNAVDHGIFCKELLMPGEDPRELETFQDQLIKAIGPRDALEASIAAQYVEAKWRMRRVRAAERDAHHLGAANIETCDGGPFIELRIRMGDMPKSSCFDEDEPSDDPRARERLREQRRAARRAIVPVSATMARSFNEEGHGSFERLTRYQNRLEISADRALRQLRQLRHERGPDWVPREEVEDPSAPNVQNANQSIEPTPSAGLRTSVRMDEHAPAQNEPISAAPVASADGVEGCEEGSCNIVDGAPDGAGAERGAMAPEVFRPVRVEGGAGGKRSRVTEVTPPSGWEGGG